MTFVPTVAAHAATRPLFIGIDIGGTSIKFGIVDDLGRSIDKSAVPTVEAAGPTDAMTRTVTGIRALLDTLRLTLDDIAAVGVGSPGPQDVRTGMIIAPDNLPHWRNFNVVHFLSDSLNKPVSFANDANAAAFGECWVGSGKKLYSIVMLTLGTGVGGGIIIGDMLIEGDHSHGGELGHIVIDMRDDALMCNSGRGHLESYCSATGVINRARIALDKGAPTTVRARLDAGEVLSPLLIFQEAEKNDAWSRQLILETADILGVGVVSLMHTIDPGAVIIGGAMTFGGHDHEIGREFLERVKAMVHRRAFPIPAARTTIDFASLGADAGYIGAAGFARVAFHKGK